MEDNGDGVNSDTYWRQKCEVARKRTVRQRRNGVNMDVANKDRKGKRLANALSSVSLSLGMSSDSSTLPPSSSTLPPPPLSSQLFSMWSPPWLSRDWMTSPVPPSPSASSSSQYLPLQSNLYLPQPLLPSTTMQPPSPRQFLLPSTSMQPLPPQPPLPLLPSTSMRPPTPPQPQPLLPSTLMQPPSPPAPMVNFLDLLQQTPETSVRTISVGESSRSSKSKKKKEEMAPYVWAKKERARIHSLAYLRMKGINEITGEIYCKYCQKVEKMSYNLEEKFLELKNFIRMFKLEMRDRAPDIWSTPEAMKCSKCGKKAKPVIGNRKYKINWLFLLLGQKLGFCTLEQLKNFCKHSDTHKTGAKDRVLYLAYMGLCKMLEPNSNLFDW